MLYHEDSGFEEMDRLSEKKVPYFFMIDFLKENIEIFLKNDLNNEGLLIEFQYFKNTFEQHDDLEISWEIFPESQEEYRKGFDKVQQHLRKGNSYLVNFTRKTLVETNRSLEEIFYISKAKYKVYYPGRFVFFSPETFVKIIENQIYTYPMKGTVEARFENAETLLKNNIKEKAEHYTVVDLLRNDLSMVADEVNVNDFQRIDLIKTRQKDLLAMSSEISGKLKPQFRNKTGSLMKMLLPAGSILGAPKHKTLEIVLETEKYDRGFYSGVCGWFDGENLDSAVMIRFIENENGKMYFKSGGGITHMSKLADEYQEMKNKIYVPVY